MEDEYANINTQHITAEVMIPKLENIIDVYYTLPDAKSKNDLLKEVIEKVVYIRSDGGRWVKGVILPCRCRLISPSAPHTA